MSKHSPLASASPPLPELSSSCADVLEIVDGVGRKVRLSRVGGVTDVDVFELDDGACEGFAGTRTGVVSGVLFSSSEELRGAA